MAAIVRTVELDIRLQRFSDRVEKRVEAAFAGVSSPKGTATYRSRRSYVSEA